MAENSLPFDTKELMFQSALLKTLYAKELREKKIPEEELPVLLYLRSLDGKVGIDSIPDWEQLPHDFKVGIDTLLEFEVMQQRSIAEIARGVKRILSDQEYKARMIELYQTQFKPFYEQIQGNLPKITK